MSQVQGGERTWIDHAADQFERKWQEGGERPRIEEFLAGQAGSRRARLLEELVRVERELREGAGEEPSVQEYLQRFPEDGAAIDAAFQVQDQPGPPPRRPPVSAAHSLLFGLLALQNNFIDRDTLLAAFNAWVADKSKSLGQILLDRGALSPARHAVLLELVREHMDRHGDDAERSLAVLSVAPAVRDQLEQLPDLDLHAGLLALGLDDTAGEEAVGETTASWDEEGEETESEGRFRIIRFHDRGALGEVYVARDQQLHRIVALKRIKLNPSADQEKRARFVVEAEITGRLEHPGIVPVYGLGTFDDGRPFYAMRFIRGDNLRSAIEQFHKDEEKGRDAGARTLALHKLLRRFLDVCNAIDYAHSRGVLHRDLKPGNIMLGKFGETLVVDWGLAKTAGRPEPGPATATMDDHTLVPQSGSDLRGTEFGARLGTPAYMSPEQAAGRIDALGPASDVYSLGATLYCVLTGQAPFTDTDIAELLRKVERGDFPPPRKLKGWIDPALEAICLRAMATEPATRYRTPRALADDVEHWLADEPVSAWREPFSRRVRRWSRRNRTVVMTASAAVLVALVGTAAVLAVQTHANRRLNKANLDLRVANAALSAANAQVSQANADLTVANGRVVARFDLALEAVKLFHGEVSEDLLLKERQFDALRTKLLGGAADFYRKLEGLLKPQADQASREALGRAYEALGEVTDKIGSKPEALAIHRQALAVRRALAAEPGAEAAITGDVTRSLLAIGELQRMTSDTSGSLSSYRESLATCEALARANPDVTQFQSNLARSYLNIGILLSDTGMLAEALEAYGKARAIQQKLADAHPAVTQFQSDLARSHNNIGLLLSNTGKSGEALASHQAARAILQRLADAHPAATQFQSDLAKSHVNVGGVSIETGKPGEALASYQAARAIQQKLADAHPAVTQFQSLLGASHIGIGILLKETGQPEEALAPLKAARAIQQRLADANPTVTEFQIGLANTLLETGDVLRLTARPAEARSSYEEALAIIEVLTKAQPAFAPFFQVFRVFGLKGLGATQQAAGRADDAVATWRRAIASDERTRTSKSETLYYLAGCHARLGGIAGAAGSGLSAAEGAAELDRAMGVLRRSVAAGFQDVSWMKRDPDLDPLRARPDFQALMMDLTFPDDPFGS